MDIPSKRWGVSFGNSKEFTGLRFNFRDAGALIKIVDDGRLRGVAVSPFNHLKGTITGLSIGIVNYAYRIEKGIQLGLVNIVRDNRPGLRILPVFNADFR